MLRTITLGNYIQIQGLLVRTLSNGKVVISTGNREFIGQPVARPS